VARTTMPTIAALASNIVFFMTILHGWFPEAAYSDCASRRDGRLLNSSVQCLPPVTVTIAVAVMPTRAVVPTGNARPADDAAGHAADDRARRSGDHGAGPSTDSGSGHGTFRACRERGQRSEGRNNAYLAHDFLLIRQPRRSAA
jgi:hypothetical protein